MPALLRRLLDEAAGTRPERDALPQALRNWRAQGANGKPDPSFSERAGCRRTWPGRSEDTWPERPSRGASVNGQAVACR